MKTFQFKIKSYDNEEGEYCDWQKAESGTIIQLILNHWFNETLPNNLDVVAIKNPDGDQLVLDHERKDAFRYFFIPKNSKRSYYYKMTDITFMFFTLESFLNNLKDDLINNMNKTQDDWRWVRGDFLYKSFRYKIRPWALIKHFTYPLFWTLVCMVLIFLMIQFSNLYFSLFLMGIIAVIVLFNWRVKHKIGWYLDHHKWEIVLSRGDRFIHVHFQGQRKSIPKADIISLDQHFEKYTDEDYDTWLPVYTEIRFANGSILNITDFMMRQSEIKEKFYLEAPLLLKEFKTGKIALRNKTNLSAYFRDALNRNYLR